jgi:hypothetical protein
MAKLRCNRGAHPPYSPDRAICDFYLLSRPKDKLAGFHLDDNAEFLRGVQGILTAIDPTEVQTAFEHWIGLCPCVGTNKCEYYSESQIIALLLFFTDARIFQ